MMLLQKTLKAGGRERGSDKVHNADHLRRGFLRGRQGERAWASEEESA